MSKYFYYLKKLDWVLFFAVICLTAFGLSAIYSVNLSFAESDFLNFKKQIIFFLIGLVLMFAVSFFDYRLFRSYATLLYVSGIGVALLGLVFGITVRGTRGWLEFGGFRFQVVEFLKICLLVYLARFFSDWAHEFDRFKYVFMSGVLVFIPFVLILLQPDFGSAMVVFFLWLGLFLMSGFRWGHIIRLALLLALGFMVGWFFLFAPYQKARVISFLYPASDPLGRGYNIAQAVIASGAGQWFGRGLGFGSQSQLKFLPESQTDFIFAVIAEELGFAGTAVMILLILVLFYRMLRIAVKSKDDYGLFLTVGVILLFFIHFFINIAMNIGMAPVTGIPLPFVSYGGSFLIVSYFLVGMVQSVRIRQKT